MRVRVINGTVWRGGLHAGPGVVLEVPDSDWHGLIKSGACEVVAEPVPVIPVRAEPAPEAPPVAPAEPAPAKRKRKAKRKV